MPLLNQQLNIKQEQKLSPLQIQVIKMLEFPSVELEERIREEIMDNPALELGKEESDNEKDNVEDDINFDDSTPNYMLYSNNYSADIDKYTPEESSKQDLSEFLNEQLLTLDMSQTERQICEYIVGNIDSNGYIRREEEEMIDDIAITLGLHVTKEELQSAIENIQKLEPYGVGARSLQECLLIQLQIIEQELDAENENIINALEIVEFNFDALTKKNYDVIIKNLGITREELIEALNIIKHLNPNPGANYGNSAETIAQTITPDFIVENCNGELIISLNNGNIPELRISSEYNNMLRDYASNSKNQTRKMKEAIQFAKQKIESAQWFIDSIKQRNITLLQTIKTIVELQKDYFLSGDERSLRPMKLKDVADKIGVDISTISRVNNSKYVETEWGIIPLKFFFSRSMSTIDGEEISNKEIKSIIRDTIENENKEKPISDEALTEILNKKGYKIARRTTAKYREQMNIDVARLRKKF